MYKIANLDLPIAVPLRSSWRWCFLVQMSNFQPQNFPGAWHQKRTKTCLTVIKWCLFGKCTHRWILSGVASLYMTEIEEDKQQMSLHIFIFTALLRLEMHLNIPLSAQPTGYNVRSSHLFKPQRPTVSRFVTSVAYHLHIICFLAVLHMRRSRGWWFCRQQLESRHWIILRKPGGTYSLRCGIRNWCFLKKSCGQIQWFSQEVRPSPPVIMVTKTGIMSQTMNFS